GDVCVPSDVDARITDPVHREVESSRSLLRNARINPANVGSRDWIAAYAKSHVVVRDSVSTASAQIAVGQPDFHILPPDRVAGEIESANQRFHLDKGRTERLGDHAQR